MSDDNNQELVVGTVVKSVAGGPDMSVNKLMTTGQNIGQYRCQWFAGKKLESGFFYKSELVLVKEEQQEGSSPSSEPELE